VIAMADRDDPSFERDVDARFGVLFESWQRTSCASPRYAPEPELMARLKAKATEQVKAERQRVAAKREADQIRAFRAETAGFVGQMQSANEKTRAAAYREWIKPFARLHNIDIILHAKDDEAGSLPNWANWRQRQIVVRPIIDDQRFAVALHEAGHILTDDCPRVAPHYVDPEVRDWHHCLKCELDAWQVAMRVAPVWTAGMHARMRSGLSSYVNGTPGSMLVREEIERVLSDATFMDQQLRRRLGMLEYSRQRLARAMRG